MVEREQKRDVDDSLRYSGAVLGVILFSFAVALFIMNRRDSLEIGFLFLVVSLLLFLREGFLIIKKFYSQKQNGAFSSKTTFMAMKKGFQGMFSREQKWYILGANLIVLSLFLFLQVSLLLVVVSTFPSFFSLSFFILLCGSLYGLCLYLIIAGYIFPVK